MASHGSHVGRAWIECLAHWLNEKKETSFIFSLLLSTALLFFSKSSTKIPSRLLPVFAIKIRTIHLVSPSLCPCFPMISKMQLTSAPLWHLTKSLKSKAVWICMMVKTALWSRRPYPHAGTLNHHQIISGVFDAPFSWWPIVTAPYSPAPGQAGTVKPFCCVIKTNAWPLSEDWIWDQGESWEITLERAEKRCPLLLNKMRASVDCKSLQTEP